MEFGRRRQLEWYWLVLFGIYCTFVVFELFNANPYLYSHQELRAALETGANRVSKPFPTPPATPRTVGDITGFPRWSMQSNAVDPKPTAWTRNMIEASSRPVELGENFNLESVSADESGFYVTGKTNWVAGVSLEGEIRWRFLFHRERENDASIYPALMDTQTVYVVHPQGEIVALEKEKGLPLWDLPLNREIVARPFLFKEFVVLPVRAELEADEAPSSRPGVQWLYISRATGELMKTSPRIDVKDGFLLSYNAEMEQFFLTVDNKVIALEAESLQVLWSQILTDPIKGPATVNGPQLYLATLGAKIVNLDIAKKGKVVWESDLTKPAAAPPTILPLMNRISVRDEAGNISVFDAKTGKSLSQISAEGRHRLPDTWSARIKSSYITDFKMDWLHKGWTVWGSCGVRKACIFTPKGLTVARINLAGEPVQLPVSQESRLVFFVQTDTRSYAVSHVMDEKDYKKLKAEQAAAAKADEKSN